MQIREQRRRLGIARGVRAVRVRDRLRAEILDQRETAGNVSSQNARRRIPLRAQALRDREEGADVRGEPRDFGVGLAETERRTARSRRQDHEDRRRAVRRRQPFIRAAGRIAVQRRPTRVGPARAVEQNLDRARALEARRHRAPGAQFGAAEFVASRGIEEQRYLQSIRGQRVGGALRPLDQSDGALDRLVPG